MIFGEKSENKYIKHDHCHNLSSLSSNMSSLTVAFSGTSSVLRADFFPEITLDPNSDYCCGLLDFTSYNSIPNIVQNQNSEFKFQYAITEKVKDLKTKKDGIKSVWKTKSIALVTGSYEVEDILKHLQASLEATVNIKLSYEISVITSKVKISFNDEIKWIGGTLLNVLGFQKEKTLHFKSNTSYWSTSIVKITEIDVVRIECDIVSGSYINGKHCHTIHQFSHCKVSPGYKFIEVPQHIIYFPIKEKRLRTIQISIIDQNDNPINFRGEQISCRIHIKKVNALD